MGMGRVTHLSSSAFDVHTNSFEKSESSGTHNISSVIRVVKGDSHVRLGTQVVHFVRTDRVNPLSQGGSIREVTVVQFHAGTRVVRVDVNVFQPLGIEIRGSADNAMHLVSFLQQEFGQVGSVLAGDACDQCLLSCGAHICRHGF